MATTADNVSAGPNFSTAMPVIQSKVAAVAARQCCGWLSRVKRSRALSRSNSPIAPSRRTEGSKSAPSRETQQGTLVQHEKIEAHHRQNTAPLGYCGRRALTRKTVEGSHVLSSRRWTAKASLIP